MIIVCDFVIISIALKLNMWPYMYTCIHTCTSKYEEVIYGIKDWTLITNWKYHWCNKSFILLICVPLPIYFLLTITIDQWKGVLLIAAMLCSVLFSVCTRALSVPSLLKARRGISTLANLWKMTRPLEMAYSNLIPPWADRLHINLLTIREWHNPTQIMMLSY